MLMFVLNVLKNFFAVWCCIKRKNIYTYIFMYFVTEGETLVIIVKGIQKRKSQKQECASLD